jgi:hypothetical protein
MSMQDLPVSRRRNDQPDLVQASEVSSAPPWDSVLDRLATLERSHADLARFVASIHEALPPEIAAATGRTLALGSPIDAMQTPASYAMAAPAMNGMPLQQLPERVEPPLPPAIDPFAQTYEAPDPWAAPAPGGDSFFQPMEVPGIVFPSASTDRPKRRMFRSRRAAKEAQARIAAEFAAPPPPQGFYANDVAPMHTAPPPPPGFGASEPGQDFGLPLGWGTFEPPSFGSAGEQTTVPPPPPGLANDFPNAGFAAPPGWLGSASDNTSAPPPPVGFAADMPETHLGPPTDVTPLSWGSAPDLASPSDFEFDQPEMAPPPGFGSDFSAAPPPPPPGFGASPEQAGQLPPPPPGFGPTESLSPPPGYSAANTMFANEVFGDLQEVTSLVPPHAVAPQPVDDEEPAFLAGTGTDRTNYATVPPITPDFFARSAGKGRR